MYNAYGDNVSVSFRLETNNDLKVGEPGYWDWETPYQEAFPKTKYIMEVKSEEFFADVSIDVHHSAKEMTDAIASCLVAGLKLIDGWQVVMHSVVSQMVSALGLSINESVSEKIAQIDSVNKTYNDIPKYKVSVPMGIGFNMPTSKDMVAEVIDGTQTVSLKFYVLNRGKTMSFKTECIDEYFAAYGSHFVETSKSMALSQLHAQHPELGTDWEVLRVLWFGNSQDMKEMGVNSFIGKVFKPGGYFNPAAEMYTTPPLKQGLPANVQGLPGVGELVKHPVEGGHRPLWNVIVDLNDRCGWSRERVADWLETLDIDISFGSKNEQD